VWGCIRYMLDVIVRSLRDADAVKAMLKTFYPDWEVRVYTLHGVRKYDEMVDEINSLVENDHFYILMLGRQDQGVALKLDKSLPPNIAVHIVPRSKIRNTRIEHLAYEFSIAKSKFRLAVNWSSRYNSFVFGLRQGVVLEDYEFNPAYDVFLGIGEGFRKILEKILRVNICNNPLLVRKFSGEHDIYCGVKKIAKLSIPDEGFKPSGKYFNREFDPGTNRIENLLKANNEILKMYEEISLSFLKKYSDWADTIIIPWSGGKDSTASLLLALKAFPRDKIKVLFSDTGTEFPWTIGYVEELADKLGIEIYRVYAGVDKGLLKEKLPMPTHDNRWCTARKIASITKGIARLSEGKTLIVTGDRDAESKRRSIRSPVRRVDSETMIVSPLKFWSAAHVQLYILWSGYRLNPLYEMGFYRIGCYICPALRSWELYIMTNDPLISTTLNKYELYRKFLKHRLKMKHHEAFIEDFSCDILSIYG